MGFFDGVFGVVSTKMTNDANRDAVEATNKTNLNIAQQTNDMNYRISQETNQLNQEQAELAYKRSLPAMQVANMMASGMSKTAALKALSGGGSYSAPVMTSATMEPATMQASQDVPPPANFDIDGMLERLSAVQANSTQVEFLNEQIKSLKDEIEFRQNEEKRRQEQHDLFMDKERYSKWEREKKDEFFSLMENIAQEKNLQPSENQSMHDYVRELGLQDNELYKSLPSSARTDAFNQFKQLQEENRAQREQLNRNIESHDKHRIAAQTLQDLKDHSVDFNRAKTARDKEYKSRALVADVNSIVAEMNLNKEQLRKEFEVYTRKDGSKTIQPHKGIQAFAKEFWETIGAVIGVEYVGDIVGRALGMLK